jgi:hypothetical protein
VPSDPYSSLSTTRRLTQRYRTLWGLGIGECQDIAAQPPSATPLPCLPKPTMACGGGYARRRGSIGGAVLRVDLP